MQSIMSEMIITSQQIKAFGTMNTCERSTCFLNPIPKPPTGHERLLEFYDRPIRQWITKQFSYAHSTSI